MLFSELSELLVGEQVAFSGDRPLTFLVTDSRKPVVHEGTIFFAVRGERHNGHAHIKEMYDQGIRQFVVEEDLPWQNFPDVNVVRVNSSIRAIQEIAARHRQQFSIPVIGVTGSNGKTIVKEWLFQLMSAEYHIIKNPGSYNSQLGVPLSVWLMQPHHTMGIFEAGISRKGEMENLVRVIRPTWGIFTNIGTAHDEHFSDRTTKIEEKLKLFQHVKTLIYCADHYLIHEVVKTRGIPSLTWGSTTEADIVVARENSQSRIIWGNLDFEIRFPFMHEASIENAMHCVAVMLLLGYEPFTIQSRISSLRAVPMRLELKDSINRCQVIDDSYNNDLAGLQISLDFLNHQRQKSKRIVILSDILQSGLPEPELTDRICSLVNASQADRFIGVGKVLSANREMFKETSDFFETTDDLIQSGVLSQFNDAVILVKGARVFQFERIIRLLERRVHGTVMEINLGAMVHNLNFIRSRLRPGTRLMVMVKAFAYGSGSVEIANLLQFHQADYLGVAYVDEGVHLRENHITTPIMVMNPSPEGFQAMLKFGLEPEIYSLRIIHDLISFLEGRPMSIHIKLNTGMNRLGFDGEEIDQLITLLADNPNIKVASLFSHLAGADDPGHDNYSRRQVNMFLAMAGRVKESLEINPLLHILNTAGILRLPEYQLGMVRLGIGLYGVEPTAKEKELQPVATLKTVISQIRNVKKGETVGYGRKGIAAHEGKLATIAIGYADGFSRAFSNGVGQVLVNGKRASVIGNVCMDMTMIDITDIEAAEGDEVIIFGNQLPIDEVASRIGTIPYEILTNTSERVKRVFVAESW